MFCRLSVQALIHFWNRKIARTGWPYLISVPPAFVGLENQAFIRFHLGKKELWSKWGNECH